MGRTRCARAPRADFAADMLWDFPPNCAVWVWHFVMDVCRLLRRIWEMMDVSGMEDMGGWVEGGRVEGVF